MAIKIFPYLFALFALLFLVQAAPSENDELPDILYIEDPGTFPAVLSAQEALAPVQHKRTCNPGQCASLCQSLGFKTGHCDANGVCVFSK
ncbi:unnamed protein product, partial [Brenthis ino]